MSKPKIDMSAIQNELQGASVFFARTALNVAEAETKLEAEAKPKLVQSDEARVAQVAREAYATQVAQVARPARNKRILIRRPMQFYVDQQEKLQHLSLQSTLDGDPRKIRDLVIEA